MWKKDYKRRRHVLLSHTTVRNEFYSETDNNLHNLINGNGQFYLFANWKIRVLPRIIQIYNWKIHIWKLKYNSILSQYYLGKEVFYL